MANLYKAKFIELTPCVGKVGSNTLFGAACCAYGDIYGEAELLELLHGIKNNTEELTFSSIYKSGYIIQRMDKVKDENYNKLVKVDDIEAKEETISSIPNETVNIKSSISEKGSIVYPVMQFMVDGDLEAYVYTTFDKEKLSKVLKLAFETGLGAKKSLGNGRFKLKELTEVSFDSTDKNGFVALSDFIPDRETPTTCYTRPVIRRAYTTLGNRQNDLLLLSEGSVFIEQSKLKTTYGIVVYDEASKTYINCKTIAYPIKV